MRREALVDMTYCFAREREPSEAVPYLRAKAYNRATYVAALERLADRYAVLDEADGAYLVARELLALGPTQPSRLDDARMLYTSIRRLENYDLIGEDITLITEALLRQTRRVQTTDELRKLTLDEFEIYARDLATRAQDILEKLRKEGKKDIGPLAREVARGYRSYLGAFPGSKHRTEILQNQAEVLGDMGAHEDSGRRYLEAAELAEKDEQSNELLYEGVVQFERSLARLTERSRVERVVVRASLRNAGRILLGTGLPPERARKVKLAIARTYYDEGQYREAIDRLDAVAWESPGTSESRAAIHLVLDSYNTLNDYDGLIAAGHRFLDASSPADAALKEEIRPIVDSAEQRRLDEVSLAAAGSEGGELVRLEKLAERYQGTRLGERALLNAFVAARAVGDSGRLYKLGEKITTFYPQSEQIPGVLASLARNAVATFDFDRALTLFDRAAKANPEQRVRLFTASGDLLDQLGDAQGALAMFRRAHAVAGDTPAAAEPASRMADLLERLRDDAMTVAVLQPIAGSGNPDVLARLGLALVRLGRIEDGEMALAPVLEGVGGASAEATARAQYGMAEALYHALRGFAPGDDLDAIQELVTLIEVTEQSYLTAARQGSPVFTPAALVRVANLSLASAKRLRTLSAPSELSMDDQEAFQKGLERRVQELEKQAQDAMAACVEQAWTHKIFNPAVRTCLAGDIYARDPLGDERLRPRVPKKVPSRADDLRQRLAKNPEDLEVLTEIGALFMGVGEHHIARLVYARAAQVGGGPDEMNQLGIASYKVGDLTGAMDAFSQAADGNLEAGRQNLATVLKELGLLDAAKTALGKWPRGKEGGQRLRGGRR